MTTTPEAKPEPKRLFGFSPIEIILATILLCLVCAFMGVFARGIIAKTLQSVASLPTETATPSHKQILEANGFAYISTDKDGKSSYGSPCGALATVEPDGMGFGASVTDGSDNNCAVKDLGRIISIMYPSEVFDYVVSTMRSLTGFDQIASDTVAGYYISVTLTEYNHTLVILIKDPS